MEVSVGDGVASNVFEFITLYYVMYLVSKSNDLIHIYMMKIIENLLTIKI